MYSVFVVVLVLRISLRVMVWMVDLCCVFDVGMVGVCSFVVGGIDFRDVFGVDLMCLRCLVSIVCCFWLVGKKCWCM